MVYLVLFPRLFDYSIARSVRSVTMIRNVILSYMEEFYKLDATLISVAKSWPPPVLALRVLRKCCRMSTGYWYGMGMALVRQILYQVRLKRTWLQSGTWLILNRRWHYKIN